MNNYLIGGFIIILVLVLMFNQKNKKSKNKHVREDFLFEEQYDYPGNNIITPKTGNDGVYRPFSLGTGSTPKKRADDAARDKLNMCKNEYIRIKNSGIKCVGFVYDRISDTCTFKSKLENRKYNYRTALYK